LKDKYSDELKHLVKSLLERDPTNRLGHEGGMKKGAEDVLNHPAFKELS
jgi:hypothetical protein